MTLFHKLPENDVQSTDGASIPKKVYITLDLLPALQFYEYIFHGNPSD